MSILENSRLTGVNVYATVYDMENKASPRVEVMNISPIGLTEFILRGGDIAPGWRAREEPWCRIGVWDLGGPSEHVGSYGGEVWPLAWPQWFKALPSSAQAGSGGVEMTDECRAELLAAAEKAATRKPGAALACYPLPFGHGHAPNPRGK